MRVGIGYSENPDTRAAGREAAEEALRQAKTVAAGRPCDLVMLFATARHDSEVLRASVAALFDDKTPIIGGGAVGAISGDRFGYAGDQVGIAAIWFEKAECKFFAEGGINDGEVSAGENLGKRLAKAGISADSPVLLFYDAIDRSKGDLRLVMATYLLAGIEKGLGFMPRLVGAGFQGDFMSTPTRQFTGDGIGSHQALALAFGGDVRMDTVILHGCRPVSSYYTVTRAERQTILEINGEPALPFMQSIMGPSVLPDDLPFFLILGMNRGDKWSDFNENDYANRLCLAVDKERNGIVMFEPDMVEGTEFQIMQRSLDLEYMPPKIESLFEGLGDREPVFALYIDCAGRAAGYAGMDMEDAEVVQRVVNGRVPLLGLYTGVEIAPVRGRSSGLDWTGVFNLFSVPK